MSSNNQHTESSAAESTAAETAAATGSPGTTAAETITRLHYGDREIVLVGTAHISEASVNEVQEQIRQLRPDRVCVELDEARFQTLTQTQQWQELDIFKIFKEKKAFLLLGNLVLGASQRRMGLDLGVKPGAEMLAAIETARSLDTPISLIDRQIHVTLRRAWAKSSFWGKNKLLASLIAGAFTNEKLSEAEIESLKNKGELQTMLEETADYLPSAKAVLIDERDLYLARKLVASLQVDEKLVLAVVGAGHVPGMVKELDRLHSAENAIEQAASQSSPSASAKQAASVRTQEADPAISTTELDGVPEPSVFSKIFPWVLSAGILFLIVLGFIQGGVEQGLANFGRWMLTSGSLAAVGALLALGHPVSILVAFVATPFTILSPTIGIGFVVGPLEAFLRKPRVSDFESLRDSVMSVKGFYRNRVTRILLVFMLSSLGAMAGTFIALPLLFPGV